MALDGLQKASKPAMGIKVLQSPPGATALATAPTAFAVTFTPDATTVTAASAIATTAQAWRVSAKLIATTNLTDVFDVKSD